MAVWMARTASFSSEPPHIQPPIAQVPRAMRDARGVMPAMSRYSIFRLQMTNRRSRRGVVIGNYCVNRRRFDQKMSSRRTRSIKIGFNELLKPVATYVGGDSGQVI